MQAHEWDTMVLCQEWLQSHNLFVKLYKTSLETLTEHMHEFKAHEASSRLLPYADSAGIRTADEKLLSHQLGPSDAALLIVDFSEYKGAYHKLASSLQAGCVSRSSMGLGKVSVNKS